MIWVLGTPGVWYLGEWYGGAAPALHPKWRVHRLGLGLGLRYRLLTPA